MALSFRSIIYLKFSFRVTFNKSSPNEFSYCTKSYIYSVPQIQSHPKMERIS